MHLYYIYLKCTVHTYILLLAINLCIRFVLFVMSSTGLARIRVQLSSEHTKENIDKCVDAFISIGKRKQVIP